MPGGKLSKFAYLGNKPASEDMVYKLFTNPPKLIAVDTESVSLKVPDLVGIAIATSRNEAFYFPILPEPSPYLLAVIALLQDTSIVKVYHNSLYDLRVLAVCGVDKTNIVDTLIMAHLAGERDADLPSLYNILSLRMMPEFPKIRDNILEWPTEQIVRKCCSDAEATYFVYEKLKDRVDESYLRTEMELVPVLLAMSEKGIRIDQELRAIIEEELSSDLVVYRELAEDIGFNPASPKQVAYMLAKDNVFLPYTRSRKSLRTDEKTLLKVSHPIAGLVLAYREASKLLSTYIKPLAGEDRCYTRFHLDAITGRVTSTQRNLQNIPQGRIRNIFLPDRDYFSDLDFSQIELRTVAYIAQDEVMQGVFDSDGDIHQATADALGITRKLAKNTNFSFIYGATDTTIMETAGIRNLGKAKELRTAWGLAYPKAMNWIENQQLAAPKAGYITTLYGRRIPLPMEEPPDALKRKAVNYTIQASAAEIVKRAMLKCAKAGLLASMRLQVHDELLLEGNMIKELGELGLDKVAPFPTPYSCKLLTRWE